MKSRAGAAQTMAAKRAKHDLSVLDLERRSAYEMLPEKERTYELVKEDVERRFFKVIVPFQFCLLEEAGHTLMSYRGASRVVGRIVYFERTKAGGWVVRPFKSRWLADPLIRTVKRVCFDPSRTKEDIYNTFSGLRAERLPSVGEDEVEGLCAPVFAFIEKQLCDWFANLLQDPGKKSCLAPILHGADGCGHSLFVDWVRTKLVGAEHTLTGAKRPSDFDGKLLIHVHGNERMDELIKASITDQIPDGHLNVIYTTSSSVTADPEWTNWRCAIFRCSDAACDPELEETVLANPRVQRAFYQFMLKRDISAYHMDDFLSGFVSRCFSVRGPKGCPCT